MIENDEIIIDDNQIYNEKELELNESKHNGINIIEDENLNKAEAINKKDEIHEENKNENIEKFGTDGNNKEEIKNINSQAENNNININEENNLIQQPKSLKENELNINEEKISKKESLKNEEDINHVKPNNNYILNDNIKKDIQKVEENINQNNNDQKIISQNTIEKSNNDINICENEEFKSIENILNNKDNYINKRNKSFLFKNNNKLYFTETNIENSNTKSKIIKSSSEIELIPEFSPPGKSETIQIGEPFSKSKKNTLNIQVNSLSPKIYLKKKFVYKYNFQPLLYRIKKIKEEIENQNKYDYNKAMKDLQLKYDKEKKNRERQKHIFEFHHKLEEKLKFMEEKRNILYKERLKKILKKQNKMSNKNKEKSLKLTNKSFENKNIGNNLNLFSFNSERSGKLPIIENSPKHELIKLIKAQKEDIFCKETNKKLIENEINHRKNHLKQIHIINDKIIKHSNLYKQRSDNCFIKNKEREIKLEEDFKEKEIRKSYNVKQTILRESSAKKAKILENLSKNIENVKEKKEIIEKQKREKIKKIISKLNNEVKKNVNEKNNREYFYNLQKENYDKNNKENNFFYNEILLRHGDNYFIANELENDAQMNKQELIKRSFEEQNKKIIKLKSLNKFLDKMDKKNINNQKEETKRKLFKIELEKKRKAEEKEEEI